MERTGMRYVEFRYTDGRLPPHRTIAMAPAKVHEIAGSTAIEIVAGYEDYVAFCEGHDHEPIAVDATVEPEEAEAPAEPDPTPPTGDDDPLPSYGWPAGYSHVQRGSWYTVSAPDGSDVGKAQGEESAQALAWEHFNVNKTASSDEPADTA